MRQKLEHITLAFAVFTIVASMVPQLALAQEEKDKKVVQFTGIIGGVS